MKKVKLFFERRMAAAGMIALAVISVNPVLAGNTAFAAKERKAVQATDEAGNRTAESGTSESGTSERGTAANGAAENEAAANRTAANGTVENGIAVDAEGAEAIAFADAAVTVDLVQRLHTKTERENGEYVYEVTFSVDSVEYEYLIREEDGAILEWEIDGRDIGDVTVEESLKDNSGEAKDPETEQESDDLIGLERAKEIACSDAGVDEADVSFSKIKFERSKFKTAYEIEFYQGRKEFEYTIDGYSGAVLEMEWDS